MSNSELDALVAERGAAHGDFVAKAGYIQFLKEATQAAEDICEQNLTPASAETLDAIFVKIGRIVYGDQNFPDHWKDIAGYAWIMYKHLEANQPTEKE